MTKIIALTNQKGGVGKTTSSVNIAASLAVSEFSTLLLDMDPQANASPGVSEIIKKDSGYTVYDTLVNQTPIKDVISKTSFEYLDIVLSTNDLVGAEVELVNLMARERQLEKALKSVQKKYDYILIDCPPSLSLLTVITAGSLPVTTYGWSSVRTNMRPSIEPIAIILESKVSLYFSGQACGLSGKEKHNWLSKNPTSILL